MRCARAPAVARGGFRTHAPALAILISAALRCIDGLGRRSVGEPRRRIADLGVDDSWHRRIPGRYSALMGRH